MSQTLQSVLCITTNKYLVHVLVVLLHARFSVVGPIPFLLAAIFFSVHPYIGSTTVLPDTLCTPHSLMRRSNGSYIALCTQRTKAWCVVQQIVEA